MENLVQTQGLTIGAIALLGLLAVGMVGRWGLGPTVLGALLKGSLQLFFWGFFLEVVWPVPWAALLLPVGVVGLGSRRLEGWPTVAIAALVGALPALAILVPQNPAWGGLILSGTLGLVGQTRRAETRLRQESHGEIETRLALGATPAQAYEPYRRQAIAQTLTPFLQTLALAGLTGLSEWDGGLLLGGATPALAVLSRWQGAIALLASFGLALPLALGPYPQNVPFVNH